MLRIKIRQKGGTMGLDFVNVKVDIDRHDVATYYPEFKNTNVKDIYVRGGKFYAIWNEEKKLWVKDPFECYDLIDLEIRKKMEEDKNKYDYRQKGKFIGIYDSGILEKFIKYCKAMENRFKVLDRKVIFSNMDISRSDGASFKLNYPLEEGPIDAYEELMNTLYAPEERQKLEWGIGSIIAGDSKKIQKFFILYGDSGTGKSTFFNILQDLFDGYSAAFESKALGRGDAFALETFRNNPLVAIEHDGDLSKILDNSRLNSIVSHENMIVNEKHKSLYEMKIDSMLFMGTNRPVQMTDTKTGLKRRLIDVSPTGNLVPIDRYEELVNKIKFELSGIAYHCLQVYKKLGISYYNKYEPIDMFYKTNVMFNFVEDAYPIFSQQDYTTLKQAYDMYKSYIKDNAETYKPMTKMAFRDELEAFFKDHKEDGCINGVHVRHLYSGFRKELFDRDKFNKKKPVVSDLSVKVDKKKDWLDMKEWSVGSPNVLNEYLKDCKAQYSTSTGTPNVSWVTCRTKLNQLDCSREHYVKGPENLIVIDFDITNEDGEKDFMLNYEAARKWPKTYAETSRSDAGIHLHYLYSGDVKELEQNYDEHIEVKVYTKGSALRRKLIRCNNEQIATLSSGLPIKERIERVVDEQHVKTATGIRRMIIRNLNKEFGSTTVSMNFIKKILDDAYESGVTYDMRDLRPAIMNFAANSTNQAKKCLKTLDELKLYSADLDNLNYPPDLEGHDLYSDKPIVFYDVEVFPNLFLVNWKFQGPEKPVVRMINPTPEQIEELIKFRLVGFNCRRYDNHMLWARMMGYTNEQLFKLSQRIINTDKKSKDKNCFFGEAWNLSYTDIYDYAKTKQSLKKWEIQLKIHHQELGLPWDKPVPEELWEKVAEYCDNDVIATEAVWNETQGDFKARQMLVKLVEKLHGLKATPNDTTNSLSTKIIFGNNKHPQDEFIYTDLSEEFPGYKFENGKSTYKGYETGEGGEVWALPGMYEEVETFDVASMHPSTVIWLKLFGERYTKVFEDMVILRKAIKHGDFEAARKMFDGALAEFLDNEDDAAVLGDALKIVINSIYGLTSASFDNAFRDPRNIDNIVAKRGALFMIDLKEEVEKLGYKVIHIKTDSIKVHKPDDFIRNFICDYGRKRGYEFEIEHKFEKICLINNAVYIAKVTEDDPDWLKACKKAEKKGKPMPTRWTATGTQFAVPYVFKTLFSHEDLIFDDYCETKSVTSSLYLDFNENLPDVTIWENLKLARARNEEDRSRKEKTLVSEYSGMTDEEIDIQIDKGHNYQFVGKVGLFCPMISGAGGGILLREQNGKFYSATGADGFRWKESETVRELHQEDKIDIVYYETLVSKAIAAISQFGDFESFIDQVPLAA